MGFLCPRMQQIHSIILEYFCSNTPSFSTGPLLFLLLMTMGGKWEEDEEGEVDEDEVGVGGVVVDSL